MLRLATYAERKRPWTSTPFCTLPQGTTAGHAICLRARPESYADKFGPLCVYAKASNMLVGSNEYLGLGFCPSTGVTLASTNGKTRALLSFAGLRLCLVAWKSR